MLASKFWLLVFTQMSKTSWNFVTQNLLHLCWLIFWACRRHLFFNLNFFKGWKKFDRIVFIIERLVWSSAKNISWSSSMAAASTFNVANEHFERRPWTQSCKDVKKTTLVSTQVELKMVHLNQLKILFISGISSATCKLMETYWPIMKINTGLGKYFEGWTPWLVLARGLILK